MYTLTQSLPYLLYTISNRLAETFAVELRAHDLTIGMYRVLAALHERDDQRLGELSEMIDVEISTLSRMIGAMKTRGLVSRRRLEGDERSVRIKLTAQGRRLVEALIPRAAYYERLAVGKLGEARIDGLKGALAAILANMAVLKPQGQTVAGKQGGAPDKAVQSGKKPAN